MRLPSLLWSGGTFLNAHAALAAASTHTYGDSDLLTFVSAPQLRPPAIDIIRHDHSRTSPGYWFIAPYADLLQSTAESLHVPGQVGPHIYRDDGTLVWSGAELFPKRSICDFRLTSLNGSFFLSFVLADGLGHADHPKGAGIILDNQYAVVATLASPLNGTRMDIHEFRIDEKDSTAAFIFNIPINPTDHHEGLNFADAGFLEVHVPTGDVRFQWDASEHLSRSGSTFAQPTNRQSGIWDWLHMNSIDRTADGDFIISARHSNAVYKVSRTTGSIVWQLGGANSSFAVQGFDLFRQHDARIIQETQSQTILSVFNNGADPRNATLESSEALLIELDHDTMTARLLMRWKRPDGKLTLLRGNAQRLPDGNMFVGWADDGYMSEHSSNGEVLMEARFPSSRMSTYRAYKYLDYTATPAYPPSLKSFAYYTSDGAAMTVCYVSWNGATEVAAWAFYSCPSRHYTSCSLLGKTDSAGFETVYSARGYHEYVLAEAVASDGTRLRNSTTQKASLPQASKDEDTLSGTSKDRLALEYPQESGRRIPEVEFDASIVTGNEGHVFRSAGIFQSLGLFLLGFLFCYLLKSRRR